MNNLCQCGCGKEVIKPSNIFLFGHQRRNKIWSKESKLKARNSALSKEVQNKRKQTLLKIYNVKHQMYCKEIKDKVEKTCLDRLGVKNPSQSENIKNKKIQTCLKTLGVKSPLQSKEIKEKYKQTCLKNLGVENPCQSKEVQEKYKQTSLENWGTQNPLQSEKIKEKIRQTCLKKYGKENYSKTLEGRRKIRENNIKRVEIQYFNGEPAVPTIGIYERDCLNELQKLIPYQILRQQRFIGYFPDGYIKELNLIIEFDESIHYINKILTEQDIRRQSELINYLNCQFFRIKESEWLENSDNIRQKFNEIISCK